MDSALDIKFKKLMNEYYPDKNEKLNPLYFTHISKPFLIKKKKKLKKYLSNNTLLSSNINKNKHNNNDIIFVQIKNTYKKDKRNNRTLKESQSISLSDNNNTIYKNNDSSFKKEKKLASPDILQDKSLLKLGKGQLSINSLFNQLKNRNNGNAYINKKYNVYDLNKKYNLVLTPLKQKKMIRRMTKYAMLNNLYHKYSSASSGNKKIKNNDVDKYYNKTKDNKNLMDENLYLTCYGPNKCFNFYNIYKRNLNIPVNQKINSKIINKDNKIYIDCLLSKVDSDIINTKKIFPKSYGKTIYNLQKDHSYLRIQNLDNIFSKIMKNNKNIFI